MKLKIYNLDVLKLDINYLNYSTSITFILFPKTQVPNTYTLHIKFRKANML